MRDYRGWAIVLWTAGLIPGIFFPSTARAGFFDFLFPPPAVPSAQPFPGGPDHMYSRRRLGHGFHGHEHRVAVHRKIMLADKTDHPVRPLAPTDLMDDESLRHGDAVMMQAGIRIFVGYSGGRHRPEDFRKISEIKKLSQRERSALAALDASGSNPGKQSSGEGGVVTGRSATERKVTVGEIIKDPNGRTIRYVGP